MQPNPETFRIITKDEDFSSDVFLVPDHLHIGRTTLVRPEPTGEITTSPFSYSYDIYHENPPLFSPGKDNEIKASRSLALLILDDLLFILQREELPGQTVVQYRLEPIMHEDSAPYVELNYDDPVRLELGLILGIQGQEVVVTHPLDGLIPMDIPLECIQELRQIVLHDFYHGPHIYDKQFLDSRANIL